MCLFHRNTDKVFLISNNKCVFLIFTLASRTVQVKNMQVTMWFMFMCMFLYVRGCFLSLSQASCKACTFQHQHPGNSQHSRWQVAAGGLHHRRWPYSSPQVTYLLPTLLLTGITPRSSPTSSESSYDTSCYLYHEFCFSESPRQLVACALLMVTGCFVVVHKNSKITELIQEVFK